MLDQGDADSDSQIDRQLLKAGVDMNDQSGINAEQAIKSNYDNIDSGNNGLQIKTMFNGAGVSLNTPTIDAKSLDLHSEQPIQVSLSSLKPAS